MNKISEEHLKTIQDQQTKLNNLLNQIGYVSAQKHGLLHEFGEINSPNLSISLDLSPDYAKLEI